RPDVGRAGEDRGVDVRVRGEASGRRWPGRLPRLSAAVHDRWRAGDAARGRDNAMNVPLVDLKARDATIRDEMREAVDRVLEAQQFIMGPEVAALEKAVADYVGARHGIGMSSGTDALLAALMAYDVGPGDRVITPAYSFFATAGVIARLHAVPV